MSALAFPTKYACFARFEYFLRRFLAFTREMLASVSSLKRVSVKERSEHPSSLKVQVGDDWC